MPENAREAIGPAGDGEEIVQVPGASPPNSLGPYDATVDHGFSHAIVCIMAAQSYWSGKSLYWDPRQEQILDHTIQS
jgi:hypothetical protein